MLDLSDVDKLIFVSSVCLNESIVKIIGEQSDEKIFEFSIWD